MRLLLLMAGGAMIFFLWNSGALDGALARFENQMYGTWFMIRQAIPLR